MEWEKLPLTVLKFGGSSVADSDRMRHVAQIVKKIRDKGFRVAVVVSAMGNMTDELLALASASSSSVMFPIAETTTATRKPLSRIFFTICATCLILSESATDEPPNLSTVSGNFSHSIICTPRLCPRYPVHMSKRRYFL